MAGLRDKEAQKIEYWLPSSQIMPFVIVKQPDFHFDIKYIELLKYIEL